METLKPEKVRKCFPQRRKGAKQELKGISGVFLCVFAPLRDTALARR
jgi:hypothetical protein